jgi:nitrogen fixation protein NifX
MTENALSREIALRIGMAARVLPNVSARHLLDVLIEKLGSPLTEEKLSHVTVTQIKTGLGSPDGEEDTEHLGDVSIPNYKEAVRILWGDAVDAELPEAQAYQEGDMPGSIRVAIASNTTERMDGHFGSCLRFLIYQVSQEALRLVDVRSAFGAEASDDRNAFRADLIKDCQVLYVVSIGGPAAAKVIKAGVYPMKRAEDCAARDVLAELQTILGGSPPPWLAKIIGVSARNRVRFDSEYLVEEGEAE